MCVCVDVRAQMHMHAQFNAKLQETASLGDG
jgi:hypothetical protein